ADGRHSTIAKLVGAEEYLGYDAPRGCYWAYWQRQSHCDAHVVYNCFNRDDARIVFPADGELLLIATAPPVDHMSAWRDDHTAAYLADITSYPPIAGLLDTDLPVSEVRGVVRNRYFFRASSGPGWALLGDAGHHKDFVIGLGISDALRDARALAGAIASGEPTALKTRGLASAAAPAFSPSEQSTSRIPPSHRGNPTALEARGLARTLSQLRARLGDAGSSHLLRIGRAYPLLDVRDERHQQSVRCVATQNVPDGVCQ